MASQSQGHIQRDRAGEVGAKKQNEGKLKMREKGRPIFTVEMVLQAYGQGPHVPREEGQGRKGPSHQEHMADENKMQGAERWINGAGVEGKQGKSKPSRATKSRVTKSFTSKGGLEVLQYSRQEIGDGCP